ncbi:MAG: citrate/2-methylcitrate synthase, partial [Anaeromassilibacillus sp.]
MRSLRARRRQQPTFTQHPPGSIFIHNFRRHRSFEAAPRWGATAHDDDGRFDGACENWESDDEVGSYLEKIVRKEAGDRSGLIYGMGHAVYTLSDPRAVILKENARKMAEEHGMLRKFELFERVEKLSPDVFAKVKNDRKVISANVDFYSGLVYEMLGIPSDLYTPMFA